MDSFTFNALPNEILLEIFDYLNGKNISKCRRVCKQWKLLIDNICSEKKWKEYCENDHHFINSAYVKAKLTWFELYKSLSLWSKLDEASVSVVQFPKPVQSFQLLPNGVIAVCENHSSTFSKYSDTIVYVDLETMGVVDVMKIDSPFACHKENENLICLITRTGKLCVFPKETKQKFIGKKLAKYGFAEFGHYSLLNTEVYYQTDKAEIRKARLKRKKDGTLVVKDYEILDEVLYDRVLSFSAMDKDNVYILADELTKANIYRYRDYDLGLVSGIDQWCLDKEGELSEFGFDWTEPEILDWLFTLYPPSVTQITTLKPLYVIKFGMNIIIATSPCTLNIFIHPYNEDGELILYKVKPNYKIELGNIIKDVYLGKIKMVDVVEIENGHCVTVLIGDMLFAVKFDHSSEALTRKQKTDNFITKNKQIKLSYVIPCKFKSFTKKTKWS